MAGRSARTSVAPRPSCSSFPSSSSLFLWRTSAFPCVLPYSHPKVSIPCCLWVLSRYAIQGLNRRAAAVLKSLQDFIENLTPIITDSVMVRELKSRYHSIHNIISDLPLLDTLQTNSQLQTMAYHRPSHPPAAIQHSSTFHGGILGFDRSRFKNGITFEATCRYSGDVLC